MVNLKHLTVDLDENYEIEEIDLKILSDSLSRLPNLKCLRIKFGMIELSAEFLEYFKNKLKGIEKLDIDWFKDEKFY